MTRSRWENGSIGNRTHAPNNEPYYGAPSFPHLPKIDYGKPKMRDFRLTDTGEKVAQAILI